MTATATEMRSQLADKALPIDRRLRMLWTLHAIGHAGDALLQELLRDESEYLRAWSVRLLAEDGVSSPDTLNTFASMAAQDHSAFVCLHLASALQRIERTERWPLAEALITRGEFADDANIPLMIWYAIEPLVADDLTRFVRLAPRAAIPTVRRHIARRVAAMPENSKGMVRLVESLAECDTDDHRRDLLAGMVTGLEGTRNFVMPEEWSVVYAGLRASTDASIREQALHLALIFNDQTAIESLLHQASDQNAAADDRQRAIQALVAKRVDGFDDQLLTLTRDETTRRAALRGLAEYNHPETVATILDLYAGLDLVARQEALQTLAVRPVWARALLDSIESNRIPRTDLTAFTARQIHSLGDKQLSATVEKLWGQIRETPRERARMIADLKRRLSPDIVGAGDRSHGRVLFSKTCANCHRLFDSGTVTGPDLTGAQRTNIDYLLLNLIDPSSSISNDFRMQIIETTDGRVVTGLLVGESDNAITVQTATEKLVIPTIEIELRVISQVSMMPEGLLQRLTPDEVRDLFAYITGPDQVPLPADSGQGHGLSERKGASHR